MVSIVVSACLLGEACRYDGQSCLSDAVDAIRRIEGVQAVPICPELQGGLPAPRYPAEIQQGSEPLVATNTAGEDVTQSFGDGANQTLSDAIKANSWVAVLKSKSPSCGSGIVYDGTFSGTLTEGWGVAARLFDQYGINVIDENQLVDLLREVKAADEQEWKRQVVLLFETMAKRASGGSLKEEAFLEQLEIPLEQNHVSDTENGSEVLETTHDALPPLSLKKAWAHFRTITKHKVEVTRLCFKIGLIGQGIKHDFSKYSPTEFSIGARFYQGYRSPNAAEREIRGFTEAWLHHKGRNKHHFEYWLDLSDDVNARMKPAPMPTRYVLEMLCDRIAASKIYKGEEYSDQDPWNYYDRSRTYVVMHPTTRALLERLLTKLAEEGESAVIEMARTMVKEKYCEGPAARF